MIERGENEESISIHSLLEASALKEYSETDILYYWKKYNYLKDNQFIGKMDKPEFGGMNENMVRYQLENLGVLTFEVTDKCNLRCRYCTYGDMYSGYDVRLGNDLSFEKVKMLLDYLFDLWEHAVVRSHLRTVAIGFYGGEPLLNMELIQSVVQYVEEHPLEHVTFRFNMTTNAMLLDRYADFLVAHQFYLLLSLDGDRIANQHRITPNGKASFDIVYKNIKELQRSYPDYFDKHVTFNSVIHAYSQVEEIVDFFQREFGKNTSLSELNNSSIKDNLKFTRMYRSVYKSISESRRKEEIDHSLMYASPRIGTLTYFLHHLSSEVFQDYRRMFFGEQKDIRLPGGTCIPFNRKLFVTVNGKILPCERIDHEFSVGKITDKCVELNCGEIAETYNQYYNRLIDQCKNCYMFRSCSQCLFYTTVKPDKIVCQAFKNRTAFADYISLNVKYLEENRWAYEKVMKEITLF